MKLSFDWLGDFVDLSGLSAQEVADKLTMHAFEVEEISVVGSAIEGQLLVGEIMEINPHPNADKIRITKIKLEEGGGTHEIVCGAWNIEVGHKIPVALPGAKVINRHDGTALHIKESKIRGVTSNGMLCSPPELGLSGGGEGILILDPATRVGLDAKELLGLRADYILHVEPRSNRGDALSVLGLAREVAAIFGRPLKKAEWIEEFAAMKAGEFNNSVQVSIEDQSECPYFTIRTLGSIKIAPSDQLISRRLEAIGVKTINNVVDITNYVLHELGQPLHAYDFNQIAEGKLEVRRARDGETLQTIDQKERKLNPEALIIADGKGPVGVAGVMGGKASEVSDSSTEIALEAASFNSARVRRSSRVLGLSSDSSLRFERGVDTAQVASSSDRACYLLVKYCGARLGQFSQAGSGQSPEKEVQLRIAELKRLCEIDMAVDSAAEMLEPLGFINQLSADDYNAGVLRVKVPSFRQKDVSREIDLIEEICRLYGYDKIPVSMPASTIAALPPDPLPGKVRTAMLASGLSEAWLSSLTSYDDLPAGNSSNGSDTAIGVLNPLSPEHQVLRQSLIPGLVKTASYNQDRGNTNPYLFELGKIYKIDKRRFNKQLPEHKQTMTHEEQMVSAIICGDAQLSQWMDSDKKEVNGIAYFHIKGIFENLCASLGISLESLRFRRGEDLPALFHPGRAASCFVDLSTLSDSSESKKKSSKPKELWLGYIGELHPAVQDANKLSGRIALMEVSLAALSQALHAARFEEIPNTPSTQRDLTVDLDNAVSNQEVIECIQSLSIANLRQTELVSIFKLDDAKQSLSYRLTFQDPAQTLTAEYIDTSMSKIREELSKQLQASFRL